MIMMKKPSGGRMRKAIKAITLMTLLFSMIVPLCALTGNDYITAKNEAIEKAKEGDQFFADNKFDDAVNAYEQSLDKYKELLAQTDEEAAIEEQIIMLEKNLSVTNAQAGNYEEALQFFDLRIAREPANEKLYLQKFDILKNNLSREEIGVKMLEDFLATNTSAKAAQRVGNYYYFRVKDYDNAIKWFEYYTANDPEAEIGIKKNIITAYKKKKDYPKAIELTKEYLQTNPPAAEKVNLYKSLGVMYKSLRNTDNARSWFIKYLNEKADHKVALYVCNLYYKEGNYPKTIKYADMVIEKKPKELVAYFLRGVAKHKSGDMEGAKADFLIAKDHKKYGKHAQKYLDAMK